MDVVKKVECVSGVIIKKVQCMFFEKGMVDFFQVNIEILGIESIYGCYGVILLNCEVVVKIVVVYIDKKVLVFFLWEIV